MSLARTNSALEFAAQFLEDGEGKTGLTVTVNVYRGSTKIVDEASATEAAEGVYLYTLADTETGTEGLYWANFTTAGDVDQADLATAYNVVAWIGDLFTAIDTRLATSGYTAPLSASGTRTALGLSAANLDTQLGTLATAADLTTVDGVVDAIKAKTDNLPASPAATGDAMTLTSGERTSIAAAVWAAGTRTLSGFGTLIADIWTHATRTLSAFGFSPAPSNAADTTAIKAVADKLDTMLEADGPVFRYTANALEQAPAGGGGGGGDPWATVDLDQYPEGSAGWKLNFAANKLDVGEPDQPVLPIPAPPADPAMCRVYGFLLTPKGEPAEGVRLLFELEPLPVTIGGQLITDRPKARATTKDGYVEIDLPRNDAMSPAGAVWRVTCNEVRFRHETIRLDGESFDLGSIVI